MFTENHVNSGKPFDSTQESKTILSEAPIIGERAETIPKGSRSQVTSKRVESTLCQCGEIALWKGFCYRCYYKNRRRSENRSVWLSSEYPDGCTACGTIKKKHQGNGLCVTCYSKVWKAQHPEKNLEQARDYFYRNQAVCVKRSRNQWNGYSDEKKKEIAETAFKRKYDGNGILAL